MLFHNVVQLIPAGDLDEDGQFIFGVHPHGIIPGSVLWSVAGSQWLSLIHI